MENSSDAGERKRILIAEGSTFMYIMLTSVLEKTGFEVIGNAKQSNEAITKCKELSPDILLMDIALEGDSIEAIREIANNNPSIVVIALIEESWENMPDIIVEAVRAGARGYIRKPISPEEMKKRIEGALGS